MGRHDGEIRRHIHASCAEGHREELNRGKAAVGLRNLDIIQVKIRSRGGPSAGTLKHYGRSLRQQVERLSTKMPPI
jgi:hypothetical protein